MPAEQVGAMIDARDRDGGGTRDRSLKALTLALSDTRRPLSVRVAHGDTLFSLRGSKSAKEAS